MTKTSLTLLRYLLKAEIQRLAWNANLHDKGSTAKFAQDAARKREAYRKALAELENQNARPD